MKAKVSNPRVVLNSQLIIRLEFPLGNDEEANTKLAVKKTKAVLVKLNKQLKAEGMRLDPIQGDVEDSNENLIGDFTFQDLE